jgi:hypothetical protein
MSFWRIKDADDIIYQVDASDNLEDWTEIWPSATVPYGGGAQPAKRVTVEDPATVASPGQRFLRLRVTQ